MEVEQRLALRCAIFRVTKEAPVGELKCAQSPVSVGVGAGAGVGLATAGVGVAGGRLVCSCALTERLNPSVVKKMARKRFIVSPFKSELEN